MRALSPLDAIRRVPRALWALTALAVVLQASRLPWRWNQITFAYAAYFREYRRIIDLDGPLAALTTFVGIHPPGYSLLFLGLMTLAAPPLLWMTVSGAFSVAAVPLTWGAVRASGGGATAAGAAAAVLAVSPHRNAYGLEINDYPMLVGVAAVQLLAFAAWVDPASSGRGRRRGGALAAATALAVWTHALALTLPLAQGLSLVATRAGRARLRGWAGWTGAAAVACLPLLAGAVAAAGGDPINEPPGLLAGAGSVLSLLPGRYGPAAAAFAVTALAAGGAVRAASGGCSTPAAAAAAAHFVIAPAVILAAVGAGIAADHQYPYWLVALPAAAICCGWLFEDRGGGIPGRRLLGGVLAAALGAQGLALAGDAFEARRGWAGAAETHGLVQRAVDAWGPGDSLLLVQFPTHGDDDKDVLDPAYAHLSWWSRVWFDDPGVPTQVPADPYFGQPVRLAGDRWLYTFATFDPEKFDLILQTAQARGEAVIVVHYDTEKQPKEGERLAFWAAGKRRTPVTDDNEALWIFPPR